MFELYNSFDPSEAYLLPEEIVYILFSEQYVTNSIVGTATTCTQCVIKNRKSGVQYGTVASDALRNYHILKHTQLVRRSGRRFELDLETDFEAKLEILANVFSLSTEYSALDDLMGFNGDEETLKTLCLERLGNSSWNRYYDAMGSDRFSSALLQTAQAILVGDTESQQGLVPYDPYASTPTYTQPSRRSDPEETRAKMERANTGHLITLRMLADRVATIGGKPMQSTLIDMYAELDKPYLFEVKTITPDNYISQVRKAVAQLTEYRFREDLPTTTEKVIVLSDAPYENPKWILPYLQDDRGLSIAWVDSSGNVFCTDGCRIKMDGIPTQ